MSKQSEAKKEQGYNPKPAQSICSTCVHYKSEFEEIMPYGYKKEINIRCGIGGFSVKKQGACKLHEFPKPQP